MYIDTDEANAAGPGKYDTEEIRPQALSKSETQPWIIAVG